MLVEPFLVGDPYNEPQGTLQPYSNDTPYSNFHEAFKERNGFSNSRVSGSILVSGSGKHDCVMSSGYILGVLRKLLNAKISRDPRV